MLKIKRLGQLLRANRLSKDQSLEALAASSGIEASTLSRLERGIVRKPRRETLIKLAPAYDLTADQIFNVVGYPVISLDALGHSGSKQLTVGQFLRAHRETIGKTIASIAIDVGCSKSHLSLIECGKVEKPTMDLLERVAPAYGVPVNDLFRLAGHILSPPSKSSRNCGQHTLAGDRLSDEELKILQAVLTSLRESRS